MESVGVGGEESDYCHSNCDGDRWGPGRFWFGCQPGAAGRQCHRTFGFSVRANHEKARDTQGCNPKARPSWASAGGGGGEPPTERDQARGCGIEAKIGGDRDSDRCEKFRARLSNRKGEASRRDYPVQRSPLFRRTKADRRACEQIPVTGYLPGEGVCR